MSLLDRIDALCLKLMMPFVKTESKRIALLQFINFIFIGVVNTVIDFTVYTLLTRHTAFFDYHTSRKYIANVISFLVATTFSFFSNRTWTFKQKEKPTLGEAARFYSTTSTGIVINSLLLFVFIRLFSFFHITFGTGNDLVAKFLATFITIFWNYFLKRLWVFSKAK